MSPGQFINVPRLARTVLDGIIAHYAASQTTLPDMRYIAAGSVQQIAWDCAAVIVSCGGILWGPAPGSAAGLAQRTGNPVSNILRHTVVTAQILRCATPFDGPTPAFAAASTADGLALMTDAGLLSQALVELCGPNGPPALKRAGSAIPGNVELLGPAGGFVCCEGHLTVTASELVTG